MIWTARLVGGRYDGDTDTAVSLELPAVLWVTPCPMCGDSHTWWHLAPTEGAERYVHSHVDAHVHVFRAGSMPVEAARDLQRQALTPRDREPVPA